MANLAELVIRIVGDLSNYDKTLKDAGEKTKAAGKTISAAGTKLTAGVTLPLVGAAVAAVNWASDLTESTNAVKGVFGEASDEIFAFGENSAEMVGLSTAKYQQLAVVTGAFLKNVGYDLQGAAEETINLTQRAADMASFFNKDVDQALGAIQSGLKGEFNPLEQFGVKLNAAAIAARAMEMGLADNASELTESAKAYAAINLIMEQTKDTQDDFRNTSEDFANLWRILTAQIEDFGASLGVLIIPKVLSVLNVVQGWIDKLNELTPRQKQLILTIAGLAAVVGPVLLVVGNLVTAIGAILPVLGTVVGFLTGPVGLAIAAVIAVVALLAAAWKNNWGDIQGTVLRVGAAITPYFREIQRWFKEHIPVAIETLGAFIKGTLLPMFQTAWSWISANIVPLLGAIAELFGTIIVTEIKVLVGVWQNVLQPVLKKLWEWFDIHILPVLVTVADFLKRQLAPAFEGISSAIQILIDKIKGLTKGLKNIKLPDWMTPGSPTPWETGLWGVLDAMKAVNRYGLGELQGGLSFAPASVAPAPIGSIAGIAPSGGYGGGGSESITNEAIMAALKTLPNEISRSMRVMVEKVRR